MEKSLNKLRVYRNGIFEEKIENDFEIIAKYIADTSPFDTLKMTDEFDNLILTTIGFTLIMFMTDLLEINWSIY